MDTSHKKNTGLKIGLIVLALLLITSVFYTYNLYSTSQQTKRDLTNEKQEVINDLKQLELEYAEALKGNSIMSEELTDARNRISALVDSLEKSESNVKKLFYYRKKFIALQDEMNVLLEENDRLKLENEQLTSSLDRTQMQLLERNKFNDSLLTQNLKLSNVVRDAGALQAIGLNGMGVIERRSGRQIPTERARRSDKIKICFTVPKNNLATSGDRQFYIQVIDPLNNVLGSNTELQFDEQLLNYSIESRFNYLNETMDVCEYISVGEDKFEKGRYLVNVFDNSILISTTEFSLR